jgi:hypothetical protein
VDLLVTPRGSSSFLVGFLVIPRKLLGTHTHPPRSSRGIAEEPRGITEELTRNIEEPRGTHEELTRNHEEITRNSRGATRNIEEPRGITRNHEESRGTHEELTRNHEELRGMLLYSPSTAPLQPLYSPSTDPLQTLYRILYRFLYAI